MYTSYKRRYALAALFPLTAFAVAILPARAQETTMPPPIGETAPVVTPETATSKRDEVQKARSNIQNNRTGKKQKLEERTAARNENVKERVQEKASSTKERFENRKAKLTDAVRARIQAHAAKMFARFTAAIERHEKLAQRIESRIAKLETEGHSGVEARRLLQEAAGFIQEAKTLLESAKTAFENAVQSEKPKDAFVSAHETLKQTHEKIKSAHASLVHAVRELRSGKPIVNQ
ncbi:MAG: hypothetical protein G01um101448_735 [Parcubacteria group bacterium Gr01-1014_48]|nr:MAG: hypothetical protein Greene041614_171 [Parcubacteria group bacterium Greene0416_14]TSC73492.1 MAG: hypothetical protein G01um101448_735 [Parcubacteria group bacterium Gr01-1014_48]TSD01225.1 MAG: hypothetical protein Greene101415_420 [Parcubacteria group bacterium Greene1014_15]TSD08310.1 MAG: hypothetical protein Greene07144_196 [Parcubacteria group bacterium Greene0714_4]